MEPVKYCKTIGERIRYVRQWRELTQAELARRAGIHWVTMSRIEHDVHVPTVDVLFRLADALDVSVDDLRPDSGSRGDDRGDCR